MSKTLCFGGTEGGGEGMGLKGRSGGAAVHLHTCKICGRLLKIDCITC